MAAENNCFKTWSSHLNLIRSIGITSRTDEYICPLCLHGFSESQIDQLSMEDVPQKALGGSKITITCKKCNNTCGHTIDNHLVNYLEYCDNKQFLPQSDRKVKILNADGENSLNATLLVSNSGELSISIDQLRNNPDVFEASSKLMKDGNIVYLQDMQKKINYGNLSAAILKNAYLILFANCGYSFLLDNYYNRLRSMIMSPNQDSLSKYMWTIQKQINTNDGIYLTCDNRFRGFVVIYTLDKRQRYRVMVFIPTPMIPYEDAVFNLIDFEQKALPVIRGNFAEYKDSKDNIINIRNWVYSWKIT